MSHALSCIGFYANGYGTAIDSICITGISTSGILSLDYNGLSFEWDSLSDISHKYYTSGLIDNAYAGDATDNVTVANGYLMMIPQQLTDSAAIVVYFEGEDPDIFYLNSANVDKWEAGNMYLYNLCAGKYFFEIGRRNTTVSYEGGKFEFDITSYYFSQTDTFLNIGWTVEIPDDVDWITGIYDVSDVYGDEISKTLLCAPAKYTATNDLDGGLQQATPYTEADINNLCYVDGSYSTANCYIVNNPGWHKFPCLDRKSVV